MASTPSTASTPELHGLTSGSSDCRGCAGARGPGRTRETPRIPRPSPDLKRGAWAGQLTGEPRGQVSATLEQREAIRTSTAAIGNRSRALGRTRRMIEVARDFLNSHAQNGRNIGGDADAGRCGRLFDFAGKRWRVRRASAFQPHMRPSVASLRMSRFAADAMIAARRSAAARCLRMANARTPPERLRPGSRGKSRC
jgi:hypothetical protein